MDWNNASTWGGSGVPASGDNIIIPNGYHQDAAGSGADVTIDYFVIQSAVILRNVN